MRAWSCLLCAGASRVTQDRAGHSGPRALTGAALLHPLEPRAEHRAIPESPSVSVSVTPAGSHGVGSLVLSVPHRSSDSGPCLGGQVGDPCCHAFWSPWFSWGSGVQKSVPHSDPVLPTVTDRLLWRPNQAALCPKGPSRPFPLRRCPPARQAPWRPAGPECTVLTLEPAGF